jgi:predicted nucleic acid-binding protein
MALKIVIDTNVLVSALSSKSNYHWLLELLLEEKFDLYITEDLEEKIRQLAYQFLELAPIIDDLLEKRKKSSDQWK